MKTQTQVRTSFWIRLPEDLRSQYRVSWRQNRYCADIRMLFCDYVDNIQKDGLISKELASRVSL